MIIHGQQNIKKELDNVGLSENRAILDSNDYYMLIKIIFYGAGAFLIQNTAIIVLSIRVFIT
jgi:hypothetical protein